MKRHLVGVTIGCWLAMSSMASASVLDWPVVGQVARVSVCVVGGSGQLVSSLLKHLTNWGSEVLTTVGQCALTTASQTTGLVKDVVTLSVPTPQPEEAPHEVPVQ